MAVTRAKLPNPPALQARDIMRRTHVGDVPLAQPRVGPGRKQVKVYTNNDKFLVVRKTIAPGDGSDFFVTLPTSMSGAYSAFGISVAGATVPLVSCPDDDVGDRTSSQFRAVLSITPANGDIIEFIIHPY